MVQLHVDRAAHIVDGDRGIEPAVGDPQVVEVSQGRTGEVAELTVVPLRLQLGDHHDGKHDVVFGEAAERMGVAQQDGGVDDVGAARPRTRLAGWTLA